jgi:hypothetical protein
LGVDSQFAKDLSGELRTSFDAFVELGIADIVQQRGQFNDQPIAASFLLNLTSRAVNSRHVIHSVSGLLAAQTIGNDLMYARE